jgi:hypothetical protein
MGAGKSKQVLSRERERAVRMVFECERPVGPVENSPLKTAFYMSHWTTLELPPIDMEVASVGIVDRIVAGLR